MKEFNDKTISTPIHTRIGVIVDINWELNQGQADLVDGGIVPCTFNYASQSWIYNRETYQEEFINSHSAFAFCLGDKVLLVVAINEESGLEEYIAVQVMSDDEQSIIPRPVWPVYRLGYDAVVLNATYTASFSSYGFPFIEPGSRDLINPYTDQNGSVRALGTGGGANTFLVVSEEDSDFIPHAAHEFMEQSNQFTVVPDTLLQNTPNFKGRIIGYSDQDEILIDNIPVLKLNNPENIFLDGINIAFKASTKRVIHINEISNKVTVLFVQVDYEYHYYPEGTHPFHDEESGYREPPYAFTIYKCEADLSELCLFDAMLVGRENIPVLDLVIDTDNSWPWMNIVGLGEGVSGSSLSGVGRGYYSEFSNFNNQLETSYFGKDIELRLKISPYANNAVVEGYFCYAVFKVSTNTDGTYSVDKYIDSTEYPHVSGITFSFPNGTPLSDSMPPINENNVAAINGSCFANICSIDGSEFNVTNHKTGNYSYTYDAHFSEDYEYYYTSSMMSSVVDQDMVYSHSGPDGSFEVARMFCEYTAAYGRDTINQTNVGEISNIITADTCVASYTMIIFTHVDPYNGLYGFWEVTLMDGLEVADEFVVGGSPGNVVWKHYFKNAWSKVLTRTFTYAIPAYPDTTDEEDQNRGAIYSLVNYNHGWQNAIYQDSAFPSCHGNDESMIGLINASPQYVTPSPHADWRKMQAWLHNIRHPQNVGPSGYITSATTKWPLFSLHPFGSNPQWLKLPYLVNIGNPIRPQTSPVAEYSVSLGSLIFSKTANTLSGSAYKRGQYRYTAFTEGGAGQVVQSAGAPRLIQCTGRDDLSLTTNSNPLV